MIKSVDDDQYHRQNLRANSAEDKMLLQKVVSIFQSKEAG